MKRIRFIWDFRGGDAAGTAEHHAEHLMEFAEEHNLDKEGIGYDVVNADYAVSYMIVPEDKMIAYRDMLIPHRGQLVEDYHL
jgi:hypothetical protein